MTDDFDGLFDACRILTLRRYPGKTLRRIILDYGHDEQLTLLASPRCLTVDAEPPKLATTTATHSADYRSVNYYGHLFSFSATQAPVIRLLWEARRNDSPAVGQSLLLEAASSTCNRLRDLFKRSPAWGALIVPGDQAGTFRLSTRDEIDQVMLGREAEAG